MSPQFPWAEGIGELRFDADSGGLVEGALGELLEHVPVAIGVTLGSEHRYAFANRIFRKALQPRAATLVGRTIMDVLGDLYTPEAQAIRSGVLATGEPFETQAVPIPLRPGGALSYWDVKLFPVRDGTGEVAGILTLGIEVTEEIRARAEADRQRKEADYQAARLKLAVDATQLGLWEWEPATGKTYWSDRQKELFGLPLGDEPSFDFWVSALHPDDREQVITEVMRLLDSNSGGMLELEHRVVNRDENVRWILGRGRMIYEMTDGELQPTRLLGTVLDITARKEVEEERQMLLREMNHRVLNIFSMTRSMVHLTARSSATPADMSKRLFGRLDALARAHDLLRPALRDGVPSERVTSLRSLIEAVVAPYATAEENRISIEGPDLAVCAVAATGLTLVLHELATNAVKYGALANDAGTVRVRWTLDEDALAIEWDERGAPLLGGPPPQVGFGTRLIEGSLKGLGGTVARHWREDGLHVLLTVEPARLRYQ